MREALVSTFVEQIKKFELSSSKIAIVGGSVEEPEWKSLGLSLNQLTLLNFESTGYEREFQLDLNTNNPPRMEYDLVICNQVLEHVWNHNSFFQSLQSLVSTNGLLWVSVPSSNFEHGSPDYYSAGFTDTYLANNFEATGLTIVSQGTVASKRCYVARHLFGYWISAEEAAKPLRTLTISPNTSFSAFQRIKKILLLLGLALIRESRKSRWAVESWALCKKTH